MIPLKEICVCGHFGYGLNMADGQTIKTVNITELLAHEYGNDALMTIDTHITWKSIFMLPFWIFNGLRKSKNMIIMVDEHGIRVIPWLLLLYNLCFHRSLHYIVIGGWLPGSLKIHRYLALALKKFDGIYVETVTMQRNMQQLGFHNIYILRNFKLIKRIEEGKLSRRYSEPYKLCLFSRVCKEKGIEDALNAVNKINKKAGRTVYEVDVYGRIDPAQTEWFDALCKHAPPWFSYRGVAASNESVEIISQYFLLLFPTHYYTEGIPGTIIDAFFSGVPVVYAGWESASDILNDQLGFGYDFSDDKGLQHCLEKIYSNPTLAMQKKLECWREAEKYSPHNAIVPLLEQLTA